MRESPLSSAQRPAKQAEPSKKFPSDLGHNSVVCRGKPAWKCRRLIIGTRAYERPVMQK
jgi:hypothetical protein